MKTTKNAQFEPIVEKLRKILEVIESGEGNIEESLKAYEEGIKLVRQAQDYLDSAEQRVTLLSEDSTEKDAEIEE